MGRNCRVGFDVRMSRNTGIGTYIQGLVEAFRATGVVNARSIKYFGSYADPDGQNIVSCHPFRSSIYSIAEQLEYPLCLQQCELWHAPHYNIPYWKGNAKLVVTIHDLIHWIFRKDFFTPLQALYAGKMLTRTVKKADQIIAVSRKTRDDLITHFDADPEKISVIYEGVDERFRPTEDVNKIEAVRDKYNLPETYFLYVGMIKPHKNVLWLLHLFGNLIEENRVDAGLVLVGRKDKKYPAGYEALSALKNKDRIVHIPYVEEDELLHLYSGALALIHPSLYEGFGLTLLEAMACGTPVLACRAASIPEVVGDAACLIDSCAHHEMMDAIVRLEKSDSLREDFKKRGLRHVSQFRWENAAKETAEVYERVLGK
ncbi:MAG: glycosyltransferase family 4 protein [Candidatus Omnitrophica bacterium]|nr:glycosyltransferase family 4 protein [Candidatus Omnitrophota bacterium]